MLRPYVRSFLSWHLLLFYPFIKIILHISIPVFLFLDRCDRNNNQLLEMKPRKRTVHCLIFSLLSKSFCFYICSFAVNDGVIIKNTTFSCPDTVFHRESRLWLESHLLNALMASRSNSLSRFFSNMSIPILTAGNLQARVWAELIASFLESYENK